MNIRRLTARLLLAAAGLCGLATGQANTVTATADPLADHTLTVITIGSTTTRESSVHKKGTTVRLTTTPSPGYRLMGWSGACSGTYSACAVVMSADRQVTVRFGPQLTVAVSGQGRVTSVPSGISCASDCAETYAHGTSVTLTAVPAAGQVLSAWGGACSGSAATCTLTMDQARHATARFVAQTVVQPTLTVSVSGSGTVSSAPAGINCGSDCSETFASATAVTLTATPAAGQQFNGWGGACSGTSPICTVNVGAATSVSAAFGVVPVLQNTLSVSVSGNGSVASSPAGISCGSDCSEAYPASTSVTLTATPAAGQQFSGWGGACSGTGTCTVGMTQARSVSAAFTAVTASGPVYYFSDCQSGAQPGCVAGNDANPGTSAQAPRRTLAGINIDNLPAGTQLLFARGGAWNDVGMIISNPNVTAERPLVFDSYPTAWGGSHRPWLRVSSLTQMFVFGWWQETRNDGGYTVRGLKLDGSPFPEAAGIFLGNNVHHVLLEDLEITGFRIGVQSVQNGTNPTQYTLRNSHIHRNTAMGLLGDGQDIVIEGNLFEANNFSGSAFNHAIYLGGHGRNGSIRNNRFLRNSVVNGRCTGGNVTVHGQWDGLVIENNSIEQDASDMGCYGFSINGGYDSAEWFRNVVLRNNRVINLGGCSFCLTSVPGVVVENNLVVNNQSGFHAAIVIPDRTAGAGDDADGNALIRNNTVVMLNAGAWAEGIALRARSGSGHRVVSNLVYAGTAADPNSRCFTHQARTEYQAWDHNLCFRAAGTGRYSEQYANLGAANAAGFDPHGLAVDPLFLALPVPANNWQDQLQANSPARAAAHASLSTSTDRLGASRPVPATIGAREAGTVAPATARSTPLRR